MSDPIKMQTALNEHLNQSLAEFLADYPEATIDVVLRGVEDAKTDAPHVFQSTPRKVLAKVEGV